MSSTPELDEKKEVPKKTNITGIVSFLKLFIFLTIVVLIYFASGGLVLYACKLAQSNILPTDMNCYPYTDDIPSIKPVTSNIFKTSMFAESQQSMKINFPYDDANKKNIFLDTLRNFKNQPDTNFLSNYFVSIVESLMSFNNASFNSVLSMMNEHIPESIIVLLGPLLMAFASNVILIMDNIYLMYLWISNMGLFFQRNKNTNDAMKPDWKPVTFGEPGQFMFSLWLTSVFLTIGIILVIFAFPLVAVLPFVTFVVTICSGLSYKGEMTDSSTKVSAGTIIARLFKYYKVAIMSIISFIVTISAFSRMGTVEGIWSIVIAVLIIWGVVTIDVFKPETQNYLSALVSDAQATKSKCRAKVDGKPEGKGLWYNLMHPQYLFPRQNGGKKLVSDLKKLGRIM
jgi:hypothetical protein